MTVIRTMIPGLLILEPRVFPDSRGFFFESFNARTWTIDTGLEANFVQDNHTRSKKGVLRGLHYQVKQTQGKLLRCAHGEIFDVAVDMRRSSSTFGKHVGVRLSAENNHQFWIPAGFAHGFLVLSESADVLYKTTSYYAPELERSVLWNDSQLAIPWPLEGTPILSAKDEVAPPLSKAELFD